MTFWLAPLRSATGPKRRSFSNPYSTITNDSSTHPWSRSSATFRFSVLVRAIWPVHPICISTLQQIVFALKTPAGSSGDTIKHFIDACGSPSILPWKPCSPSLPPAENDRRRRRALTYFTLHSLLLLAAIDPPGLV